MFGNQRKLPSECDLDTLAFLVLGTSKGNIYLLKLSEKEYCMKGEKVAVTNLDLPVSKVKLFEIGFQLHLIVGSCFGYLILYSNVSEDLLKCNKGSLFMCQDTDFWLKVFL